MKAAIKRALEAAARHPAVAAWLLRPGVRRLLARLPGARLLYPTGWQRQHPFDLEHGTDTSGMVPVTDLALGAAASAHAVCYAGSQPSIVRRSLEALPALDGFHFLDLGCGKGRVLLVASEFPFVDIVGVELSASLVRVARDNARIVSSRFAGRPAIRIVEGDAAGHVFPPGDLVLYLYNPFGQSVVAQVVQALEAALASQRLRRVFVVYYNPVAGHCFDASPAFCRREAMQLAYAPEEEGFGPDASDAVVIWQDRGQPAPPEPDAARIVLEAGGMRVSLARPSAPP